MYSWLETTVGEAAMLSTSLKRSETILRLLIALALGIGFVGFARGHADLGSTAIASAGAAVHAVVSAAR